MFYNTYLPDGTRRFCPPFTPMVECLRENAQGDYRLTAFEVSQDAAAFARLRSAISGRDDMILPGWYMSLRQGDRLWMSDLPRERYTNLRALRYLHGAVLIAGLGLGMLLPPLLTKDDVTTVTIIEIAPEVVALVGAQFTDPRLRFVQADILSWQPAKGTRYDSIYFDVWPNVCADNLGEINRLHRRFAHYLNRGNPDCWMSSWAVDELRTIRRRARS